MLRADESVDDDRLLRTSSSRGLGGGRQEVIAEGCGRAARPGVSGADGRGRDARSAADLVVPDGRIETITAAIVEGRATWASVRDALAIMLGGNLGEVGFTVAGTLAGRKPPLNPRQLLLVNLMTDVAPGLAVAVRPPKDVTPEDLLREGPDTSLGTALDREIIARAVTTAAGAGAAWTAARLTGRPRRASTVALAALVGTQLGQTTLGSGGDPLVIFAALGSAALLGGIIQTPGLSQFFGCTPLGPLGWSIALGASATATALGALATPLLDRLASAPSSSRVSSGAERFEPRVDGAGGVGADEVGDGGLARSGP